MTIRTVNMPPLELRATFKPETYNEKERTIDIVWTTGARVLRQNWIGDRWYEELEVSEAAIRMGRLNNGAPLLDAHNGRRLRDQIGVVERAWLEDGVGYATVRFSARAEIADIIQDIRDGIIQNVSVGYRTYKMVDVSESDDKVPIYRAVDWEPIELSFVPAGADDGAGTRSLSDARTYPVEIEETREAETAASKDQPEEEDGGMKDTKRSKPSAEENPKDETPPAGAGKADGGEGEQSRSAAESERERCRAITAAVRKAGLDPELAERMIDEGLSIEAAQSRVIDAWHDKDKTPETRSIVTGGGQDEIATRREAATVALLHRMNPAKVELTEPARDFRGLRLLDVARELLVAANVSVRGLSPMELAHRAFHSTSDFPSILADVANKSLRRAYEEGPKTYQPLVRTTTNSDFKEVSRTALSEAPDLEKLNESGEYKFGSFSESKEKFGLVTYGKKFAITRQAIINDDMDAFGRLPGMFGAAAARKQSDVVWALLTAPQTMADGKALFHADHKNLGTGGVISETTLGEARKLLRTQKGIAGKARLNLLPRYLIVPAAIETTARKFLATTIFPTKAADVNIFAGALDLIVEPRLDDSSATVYYVAADPSQIDMVEEAFLSGEQGPVVEEMMSENIDGMTIKARLDYAAHVIDHRGFVKNAGQ